MYWYLYQIFLYDVRSKEWFGTSETVTNMYIIYKDDVSRPKLGAPKKKKKQTKKKKKNYDKIS